MLRRLLPTGVGLLLGLVALFGGLGGVDGIFSEEEADARAQLWSRRAALQGYAGTQLRQKLTERLVLALPAIDAAISDPLAPGDGLYLRFRGYQFLPRMARAAPGQATPVRDL